ncbi:MAG: hypothetical protein KIT36_14765 [Alphaproteobacteria bacterium]|nr:hypothetical protein [Alphaproteobacteria bacterium]
MPSNATLVRTTEFGARPLGVRGEPLHNTHAQIRDVVRRRLDDRHWRLLAEPQAHPATGRIDWYADGQPVRAAADLTPAEHDTLRAEVDAMLADIDRLGGQFEQSASDDARLAGRALRLAAKRPDDDEYLFRVGDQPVLICWGYDKASVGAILPPAFLPGATSAAIPPPPAPPPVATAAAPMMMATAAPLPSRFPWLAALLVGLLGILLILGAAYGLRLFLPVPPELQVTELPPEPPPPPPPAPPDPTLELKAAVDAEHDREDKLKASLVALREEFAQRQALCKPPEPPKPPPEPPKPPKPPMVEKKPEPPKPAPKPKIAEAPKPPPPPAAPPVSQPPPGLLPCNAETASGGAGVTRNRHYIGDKPGRVTVQYNMKMIPDQMNVYYRGRLVATTNHPVSFFGGLSFDFQPEAGDYTVTVEVVGPRRGTEWQYRLNCPG